MRIVESFGSEAKKPDTATVLAMTIFEWSECHIPISLTVDVIALSAKVVGNVDTIKFEDTKGKIAGA